jgi:cytochrome c
MKGVVVGVGLALFGLISCSSGPVSSPGSGPEPSPAQMAGLNDPAKPEFYTYKVRPIFQANCYRCHGGMNHRGGLNMQMRAGLLKGGHVGPAIVPGDPANSLLVRLIRHEGPANDPMPMPSKQAKMSDADIATIERWIKAGAIMP